MRKILFLIFTACFAGSVFAQSPYYEINISVKKEPGDSSVYKYIHSFCTPPEWSNKGETYESDTSAIEWNLSAGYIDSLKCSEVKSESDSIYSYGNKIMVYEYIIKVIVIREREGIRDTMKIIFPVKIRSFVTLVDMTNIPFHSDTYNMANDMVYTVNGMEMTIKPAKNFQWVPRQKDKN